MCVDRDLTCPAHDPDPNDDSPDPTPALFVVRATLDLNGHTVTCGPRAVCIKIKGSTLINGTVTGNSDVDVRVGSNSLVRHVTMSHGPSFPNRNLIALSIRGDNNLIVGNTAIGSLWVGFSVAGSYNTLTDNRAIRNDTGFEVSGTWPTPFGKDNALIANVADDNSSGFRILLQDGAQVIGNKARGNDSSGFSVSGTRNVELIDNVAKRNGSLQWYATGFSLSENESLIAVNNTSRANLGDGFQVSAAWLEAGKHQALTLNHALGNQRFGFHVWDTTPDPGTVQAVISQNIAIGNQIDLKDENPDCHTAIWQDNTFDTASEACIH